MTSLNIMGRKFILERTKRNDNIEEIYTSAYVSLPSSTDTRLPHFKAKEEDCDVYEEGTNLVGKNAKYTYRSLGRHLDFLRPGLRFGGSQSSKYTYYTVEVKIDTVNLPLYKDSRSLDPHVTGTFTIKNLTPVLDKVVTLLKGMSSIITNSRYVHCIGPLRRRLTLIWLREKVIALIGRGLVILVLITGR